MDITIASDLEELCYRLHCCVDNLGAVTENNTIGEEELARASFASYLLFCKVLTDLEAILEKVLPKGDADADSGSD